jgi:hypothetical protein
VDTPFEESFNVGVDVIKSHGQAGLKKFGFRLIHHEHAKAKIMKLISSHCYMLALIPLACPSQT